MKYLISILLLQFSIFSSLGQEFEISGIITDSINNPIEYASIGVLNKSLGTVSNSNGEFKLILNCERKSDTLKFSSLGFKSEEFIISKLDTENTLNIKLKTFAEPLNEVFLTSKKMKTYTDGKSRTNTKQQTIFANPDLPNINLGTEIGRKFKLGDDDPSQLTKFKFFIKDNNFDSVKFRINIYTLNNDNRPENKLNIPNIFTSASKSYTGWIEVDLTPFNIIVKEDIIVAVEWIEHSANGNKLNLPIIIPSFGSTHYYKFGSQNSWEKYGGISSSMELTYEQ
ncbi:hypothetical protein Aeqsu_2312 [Aequorivita sublithincola DSM 14238]|uniref:Carboxypeptidase-like regulatory domain-containing protein n=1 Tax=Aequorivita sublithincola (strain DSM 14238 / LMG 21431 / ACAM 643 / 9-3) TaxID=746697 RepID=I3YXQ4_AEQSU|nr:carboxypeptidase-like regulatory domain-containing protein [Aequorivita sublithincola]AFL81772.1 hypothetical protein Aeqsu_2312 [Aequorivita sublithincola DSM 14238]